MGCFMKQHPNGFGTIRTISGLAMVQFHVDLAPSNFMDSAAPDLKNLQRTMIFIWGFIITMMGYGPISFQTSNWPTGLTALRQLFVCSDIASLNSADWHTWPVTSGYC